MKFKLHLVTLCLFCSTLFVNAQEQAGMRMDRHAGIYALGLNPAAPGTSPFGWEINLIGAGLFLDNNYGFIQNARAGELLSRRESIGLVLAQHVGKENPLGGNEYAVDFPDNGRRRFAHVSARIMGPSFYLRLGRHTLGVSTGARLLAGGQGLTDNLSYYTYYNRPFFEEFPVAPVRVSGLAFRETGLNYSYSVPTATGTFHLGLGLRFLQGYEAFYAQIREEVDLVKLPGNSINGASADLAYGLTTTNLRSDGYRARINGSGFGVDIGVMYTIEPFEGGGYRWKFGIALLDLGAVSFDRNAQNHRLQTDENSVLTLDNYNDFKGLEDTDQLLHQFSRDVLGDSLASLSGSGFRMGLPGALSLQADYAVNDKLYLGVAALQEMPLSQSAPRRGSWIALTPRFEHRWFGISAPVSLYQWQHFRVDMALRLAFFTIGTDHLGSWVSRSDLSGTDLYAAIRIFPFGNGSGKKSARSGRLPNTRRGKGEMRCYEF